CDLARDLIITRQSGPGEVQILGPRPMLGGTALGWQPDVLPEGGTTALPSSEAGAPRRRKGETTDERPHATIDGASIGLNGKPRRLTPGLRELLAYLLAHNGASEADVIHQFGFNTSSHLHKRLADLRSALTEELNKDDRKLHIKTVETRIYCEFI